MSDQNTDVQDEQMTMTEARLLDLRTYIALLMLIFGVVVTVMGISAGEAELAKAAGVNINLWSGLGMLAISGFFVAWALIRPPIPLGAEPESST